MILSIQPHLSVKDIKVAITIKVNDIQRVTIFNLLSLVDYTNRYRAGN
jgi:hypothetical protein